MYFEYTITGEICIDNNEFREMRKLVQGGASYEEAFERVSNYWDDKDFFLRDYIQDDVIAELKRRIAQSEEAKG